MKEIHLIRSPSTEQGTIGEFVHEGVHLCYSIELPWRNNISNMSCIPVGEYDCEIVQSPRFGRVYHVKDVSKRSHVLIHSGNYAGNSELGYKTHSHGCILPGRHKGTLGKQIAVLSSRFALTGLMEALEYKPFKLIVSEASC